MRILIDQAIVDAVDLFSPYGEVVATLSITPALIRQADVAIVRSVTKVDKQLIGQAERLHFVGSITAGTNHLDKAELAKRNISWVAAPGANAAAIADYVLSSLVLANLLIPICNADKTLGLIGGGHAAATIAARIKALSRLVGKDPAIVCYDPLVAAEDLRLRHLTSVSFAELLACDCISVHCALTEQSYHMLDDKAIRQLKPDCLLINTARGEVITPEALFYHADRGGGLMMDVWNNEPQPDYRLVQQSIIATPHIAGYSHLGKRRALLRVLAAFRHHQGIKADDKQSPYSSPPSFPSSPHHQSQPPQAEEGWLHYASRFLLRNYDPVIDSLIMKRLLGHALKDSNQIAGIFTHLRRNYRLRNESCEWQISHLPTAYQQVASAISMNMDKIG